MKQPWIYYIHLIDLHDKIIVPPQYDKEEFGKTPYERMLSYIDEWIGKILNQRRSIFQVLTTRQSLI